MYSTRSKFVHIHIVMFLRSFTIIDAMLGIVSASYVHSLTPPLGPTHPPLGHTLSISANVSNAREAHDASGFIAPLYCIFYIIIYLYRIW